MTAELIPATVPLTAADARVLTDDVKRDAAALWAKLLRLYEGGAHRALGYDSWAAYCGAEFQYGKSHAYRMLESARVVEALQSPIGESFPAPQNEATARELAPLLDQPDELREAWQEAVQTAPVDDKGQPQVTAAHVAEVVQKRTHVANNSGENEWYTPSVYIEAAREVMGGIDTDPASCEAANETVKARCFYTKDDDGLTQPWRGRIWMNPPYAQPLIADFCNELIKHLVCLAASEACTLVNNGTETGWGQQLLSNADAVCFPKSRIRFIDKSGNPSGAPLQGQMIVYFGPNVAKFCDVFAQFGVVFRV